MKSAKGSSISSRTWWFGRTPPTKRCWNAPAPRSAKAAAIHYRRFTIPFSGGGSIPLEAQRLGLPAYGSDLNPVAVMIGKAMIEIPPKFKDWEPVHPGTRDRNHYRNAEGLAEDVKHFGEWSAEQAFRRIGHLYPQVDLPKEMAAARQL